jgi:prepilin-type N-terminal cleavage/methylation domain-containing protein
MQKGFSLIEILVAISVFSIIIVVFLDLFSSALYEQGKNLSKSYLLSNTSYISEYISRALRMAKKDITGICIPAKTNFELISSSQIKFLDYTSSECQEFYLDGTEKSIKVVKFGVTIPLTPSNIQVESLEFVVTGEDQTDNLQPKVTMSLELKNKTETLKFQTTVSQRDLDVVY